MLHVKMKREHEKKKTTDLPKSDLLENWLPKSMSQSVLLWDGMELKMKRIARGHTRLLIKGNLSPAECFRCS